MQEYIRNFITEFCNKGTHTEKDVKELEQNIIKFGCEIFNIDESAFNDLPSIHDSNPSLYIPKRCPYCNGLGDIWVDNIDKYFEEQEIK